MVAGGRTLDVHGVARLNAVRLLIFVLFLHASRKCWRWFGGGSDEAESEGDVWLACFETEVRCESKQIVGSAGSLS